MFTYKYFHNIWSGVFFNVVIPTLTVTKSMRLCHVVDNYYTLKYTLELEYAY